VFEFYYSINCLVVKDDIEKRETIKLSNEKMDAERPGLAFASLGELAGAS
jgi:hypothetical protein